MYTSSIYSNYPTVVLGFHGCEREVGEDILSGKVSHLKKSENSYDWLGHGIYFWENSPSRAKEFAENKKGIKDPFIIGAVVSLGNCLNFLDYETLALLAASYHAFKVNAEKAGLPMPENQCPSGSSENLIRYLDCAVIEELHSIYQKLDKPAFDSSRGVFTEGKPVYPGAGFHEKNHIQLCIRNLDCIKGYFRPL